MKRRGEIEKLVRELNLVEEMAKDPDLVADFVENIPSGLSREELLSRVVRFKSLFHPEGDIGAEGRSWVFDRIKVFKRKPLRRRADLDD